MTANGSRFERFGISGKPLEGNLRYMLEFTRNNIKLVAITASVVMLAVLVVAAHVLQKRLGEQRASQMLLNARTPDQQEAILLQYPLSSSAPVALLALASGAFHSGAYDQARDYYSRFKEQYPDHEMALAAVLGDLMCQEALGRTSMAMDGFSEFVAENPDHFLAPQALFGKARCLQTLGRYEDARAVYEDFITRHPDSEWTSTAESSLSFLKREMRALTR